MLGAIGSDRSSEMTAKIASFAAVTLDVLVVLWIAWGPYFLKRAMSSSYRAASHT